uniref:Uncharacterized protein n=1 Tax=Noccaea caerulescens TaxID=107243 RepID=A0A1J3FPN4_NOCCA
MLHLRKKHSTNRSQSLHLPISKTDTPKQFSTERIEIKTQIIICIKQSLPNTNSSYIFKVQRGQNTINCIYIYLKSQESKSQTVQNEITYMQNKNHR